MVGFAKSERRRAAPKRVAARATVQDWMAALEVADRVWRAALAEDPGSASADPAGDLMKLHAWGQQLSAEAFPSVAAASRLMVGAWLNVARAISGSDAAPETRTACAPALRETTQVVDQVLTLHRTALFDRVRSQFDGAD